jgi:enoyl-CoA hydratase
VIGAHSGEWCRPRVLTPSADVPVKQVAALSPGQSHIGLSVDVGGAYVTVRINKPPVNAFTVEMFVRMSDVLDELRSDPRPVVVVGSRDIFSAGFDIKQDVGAQAGAAAAARCLAALQDHAAPVVCAVEGAAVGLGLLIATSSDILVISRTARVRMPEVTLGIASDVLPLRRFVPDPWIRRLCLLGETYTAEELHLDSVGAVLVEPGSVEAAAELQLNRLVSMNPQLLAITKRRFHE